MQQECKNLKEWLIIEGLDLTQKNQQKLTLVYNINQSVVVEDSLLEGYQLDHDQDIADQIKEFNSQKCAKRSELREDEEMEIIGSYNQVMAKARQFTQD